MYLIITVLAPCRSWRWALCNSLPHVYARRRAGIFRDPFPPHQSFDLGLRRCPLNRYIEEPAVNIVRDLLINRRVVLRVVVRSFNQISGPTDFSVTMHHDIYHIVGNVDSMYHAMQLRYRAVCDYLKHWFSHSLDGKSQTVALSAITCVLSIQSSVIHIFVLSNGSIVIINGALCTDNVTGWVQCSLILEKRRPIICSRSVLVSVSPCTVDQVTWWLSMEWFDCLFALTVVVLFASLLLYYWRPPFELLVFPYFLPFFEPPMI